MSINVTETVEKKQILFCEGPQTRVEESAQRLV